jgi:hypothetical protein
MQQEGVKMRFHMIILPAMLLLAAFTAAADVQAAEKGVRPLLWKIAGLP